MVILYNYLWKYQKNIDLRVQITKQQYKMFDNLFKVIFEDVFTGIMDMKDISF